MKRSFYWRDSGEEDLMTNEEHCETKADTEVELPWGQRFYDRPFVLLFLGLGVMFVFYTIWGLYEIWTLPQGTLP